MVTETACLANPQAHIGADVAARLWTRNRQRPDRAHHVGRKYAGRGGAGPTTGRRGAIKSDAARVDAAIFYLECQAGWRRGQLVENVAKEGGPSQHQVDVKLRLKDHLRRIRERLSAEQSALPPEEADKVIPGYTPEAHAELRSD